jgi:hypothetical protein
LGLQTVLPGVPGAPPLPPQAIPGSPENQQLVNSTYGTLSSVGDWLTSLAQAKRPANMTPIQERQYDRHCSNTNDPCKALKDAARAAIAAARPKVDNMLRDDGGMFGAAGWQTHSADLMGRINNINAIISLGQMMGCDMSDEIRLSNSIYVPTTPAPKP